MSYVPNNSAIYIAAMRGSAAGVGATLQPLAANAASYQAIAQKADAFAQAVDTAWGPNPSTNLENALISDAVQSMWSNAWPQLSQANVNVPASYAAMAAAVVALAIECNAQVVGEGINPNSTASGQVVYQQTTFTVAQFKTLGAVASGALLAAALPPGARVLAAEISTDVLFVAPGLSQANVYLSMNNAGAATHAPTSTNIPCYVSGAPAGIAGNLYACDLGYQSGLNVFATQGGQQPQLQVGISGALLNALTAGQVTLRVYYVILA